MWPSSKWPFLPPEYWATVTVAADHRFAKLIDTSCFVATLRGRASHCLLGVAYPEVPPSPSVLPDPVGTGKGPVAGMATCLMATCVR